MDVVVEPFELARRGEDCLEEDGNCVVAMVEESCPMLRGIIAGFAMADLHAIVMQATENVQRPPAPPNMTEMGGMGSWTYVQAAGTSAPPLETQTRVHPQ